MKKTKKRPAGKSSISRELILGTGVPIFLIFVQVLLMLSLVMGMQITPTVDENLKFKATAVKDEVNMFLNQFADMTEEYANDTYLQDFMYNAAVTGTYYADMPNAEYIFSHLEASANMYPGIINEYYANSGWLLNDLISSARDTCHTDYPDEDMINSDWMNAVAEADGETVFTAPYYDPTTGLNVCTVASPIYRQGKLLGMLGIDITLDIADKIFADATIDETGYSIAILSDGTVYYHPDAELKDKNVEDIGLPEEILQLYRDEDYDTVVTAEYGDKKVVATVEGIGNTGWSMIMLQDRSEAYRVVKHTTVFLIVCLAIALILISLVLLVITRRMAKPVKVLVEEAGKLANGDLVTNNCEYDENPHDELDDLMNAFSQLVDSSRKQAEVMDKLAKGNLNMEVQPRSENDLMNISIREMTETMNTLGAEVNKMTENALLGNTAYRADIGSLQGGYADLILGINATVDNIMAAVDTLRNAMVDIGNGVMPEISYDAKGDYIEAVQAIETTKATIATLTEQVNGMAATVATGSFSDPVDENAFKGEFKTLIHGINETLRMVVEKAGWYESILNSIPMPVEVMDNDANWTLVNTAMAAPMIQSGRVTDMKQLYGQRCEMGEVEINGVLEFTQSHITDKTIKAFGRTYNRQTSELLDIYGKRAGFVTTFADLTDVMRQAEYSINEVNRIEQNMKSLAQGNFEMIHSTQETDEIVMHLAEQYGRIDASIEEVAKAVEDLIKDIKDATGKAVAGDLANRITAETHAGEFGDVARGVNDIIDAITEPIEESLKVLEEMEKGNLQMKVTGDYQGDHAKMKNAINNSLKSLNEVIGDITITLANIGKGDLDPHDYGVVYTGDFMDISNSLDEIRFNLIDIMIKLSESSHQVAVGSKQLAEGASTLAAGSTKQSTAVQELSATMEQVAEQTRGNAKDARKASDLASDVMRKAEEGNQQMQSMLQSMKDINESSANISKIIKVIDDIAFQTNILALNAAVEAARAGVHGKGFAVVADEVRSLAAKSAAAASETTSLIEGSIVKVEAGTKIANKTAEALEEIVAGVTETAGLCNTIADVSEGQQEGIDQVNIGIGEISDVITENSATAEESAASSEELYGQTDTLKSLVDLFEFKEKYSLNLETSSTKAISGGVQNETPMISLDIDISDKY